MLYIMFSAFMKTAFQYFFYHSNGNDLAFESLGDASVLTLISPLKKQRCATHVVLNEAQHIHAQLFSCTIFQLDAGETW